MQAGSQAERATSLVGSLAHVRACLPNIEKYATFVKNKIKEKI